MRSESDIGEAEPRHQLSDEDMDQDSKTDHENDGEGGETDRDRDGGETDDRDNDSSSENGGKTSSALEENGNGGVGAGKMGNMFQMMNHIQSLISMAVENAKEGETISLLMNSNCLPVSLKRFWRNV